MERVEACRNIREMSPEVLLDLTQSLKYQQIKRVFKQDIGSSNRLVVTQQDIEEMAEALKGIVFFITPSVIRGAMLLAQENSVLAVNSSWLKEELV